jgi:hypothetical protein
MPLHDPIFLLECLGNSNVGAVPVAASPPNDLPLDLAIRHAIGRGGHWKHLQHLKLSRMPLNAALIRINAGCAPTSLIG